MGGLHTPHACKHLDLLPARKLGETLVSPMKASIRAWD